jgi:hypothetical protein
MTATLADFWPVLCADLPQIWDTPANRRNLEQTARNMAPVPRVALECRLGDKAPHLDLQQCIRQDGVEPGLLLDFLGTRQSANDGWARLQRFCAAWVDPTHVLHGGVAELFLEYDLDAAPDGLITPSVFFALDGGAAAVAEAALRLLLGEPRPTALDEHLARCFAACPPAAHVAYMGAMLGRTTDALRVNLKGVALCDLAPFLEEVGWKGSMPAIERWAAWAYDRVDRVTVCLDVGSEVSPRIGLECMLDVPPAAEPRWGALLDELVSAGLCVADNGGALLTVPGVLRPPETHIAWPGPWIAATLCGPPDSFSTAERRLSHVKITLLHEHVTTKGYWGAGHVWRTFDASGSEIVDGRQEAPLARLQRRRVEPAPAPGDPIHAAIAFLLQTQSHTGRWSDFALPAGPSDEWVTAFVGDRLLRVPSSCALTAARRAWLALTRRRSEELGWGYNRLTPPDADSTAWALRLAGGLGLENDERVVRARGFLRRHVLAEGGVTTYAARDPIRAYTRLAGDASFAGWQAPHSCVTAAAAPIVGDLAVRHLAAHQHATGNWTGYWWADDEYTTALAAEAHPQGRAAAARWAVQRLGDDGAVRDEQGTPSAWATAWCLSTLALCAERDALQAGARAREWLVGAQRDDGSWRASARMRVPLPGQVDARAEPIRLATVDQNRVFTTAAVVATLALDVGAG